MALKFKRYKETGFKVKGRDLFKERARQGISRDVLAERIMARIGGGWYDMQVKRMEDLYENKLDEKTFNALQKALQTPSQQ